ncbi:hypothetical protein CAPTEDRAFT_227273, partial [Capitella teleta]
MENRNWFRIVQSSSSSSSSSSFTARALLLNAHPATSALQDAQTAINATIGKQRVKHKDPTPTPRPFLSTSMDKVRRLLSSPSSKRKSAVSNGNESVSKATKDAVSMIGFKASGGGYFGVALEEICQRESRDIPSLVTRTCSHVYNKGLHLEGLFRVNGNSRLVENLRLGFDGSGDADIEGAGDVMAVAGLLKLFLRELPSGLVPEALTTKFVLVQEDLGRQPQECLHELRRLLSQLPVYHYHTLKYLMRFLVLIAKNENFNKMGSMALGIVFGPNVFRCSAGIQGLREQGVTNHIMLQFIRDYDALFLAEAEESPHAKSFVPDLKKGRVAPPRPPPPRSEVAAPVPSPRKQRSKQELESNGIKEEADLLSTPRYSDEEFLDSQRAASPINLQDTDRSEKGMHQGALNALNTEVLEEAITSVVAERLFGSSSDDSLEAVPSTNLVPAPRKRRKEKMEGGITPQKEELISVKQRIQKFEIEDEFDGEKVKEISWKKQRAKSEAESQGIVISGPAPLGKNREEEEEDEEAEEGEGGKRRPIPHPRSPRKRPATSPESVIDDEGQTAQCCDSDDSGFGTIQRPQNTLNTFKRAPGPKNRRNPTRTSLKKNNNAVAMTIGAMETDFPPLPRGEQQREQDGPLGFLDLHSTLDESSNCGRDQDASSCGTCSLKAAKPYVPPLDLSILHEHGNGSEPIRADPGLSLSLQKLSQEDPAMLSPHTTNMNRKSSKCEDDQSALVKQLTKRIQSCKRKIKSFEESFELEVGYRPSQSDKASRPEIKKCIQDLAKARKELRRVKEEAEHSGIASTLSADPMTLPGSVSQGQTLDVLMSRLRVKRREGGRPEDLNAMTREQVHDEKLAVQKALLHFEGIHGR